MDLQWPILLLDSVFLRHLTAKMKSSANLKLDWTYVTS